MPRKLLDRGLAKAAQAWKPTGMREEPKVSLKVFRSLQAKCVHLPVQDDAVLHCWLFSRSGFEDSVKTLAGRDPYLHLVGMDELPGRESRSAAQGIADSIPIGKGAR